MTVSTMREYASSASTSLRVGKRRALRRFMRNRMAVAGAVFLILWAIAAIVGPFFSPYDPYLQDLTAIGQPPSAAHWLGTDELGRDILVRILLASRTGFMVGALVTATTAFIGTVVGVIAGHFGGWIDTALSRLTDVVLAFPYLLLGVFFNATMRNPVNRWVGSFGEMVGIEGLANSIVPAYVVVLGAIAIVLWGPYARLVRGEVLSITRQEFVTAARADGSSHWRIIRRHLLPNAIPPIIVQASLTFGSALLMEASLSFLGIGIQPPGASIGRMIFDNLTAWRYQPHLVLVPTGLLALVLYAFSLVGDGLNDALDPRREQ